MVIDLPRKTEEEYRVYKSQFYKKDNPPEIEVQLEEIQHEVVVNGRYDLMPKFQFLVSNYIKSFILQHLKHGKGVPEDSVASMVEEATTNFLRRYFRFDNPIVGGSFGGIFDRKVQEVVSNYFKNERVKANISIDTNFYDDPENTYGNYLSYKKYIEEMNNSGDYDGLDIIFKYIEEICANLEIIKEGLSKKWLAYIYYLFLLSERRSKKNVLQLSPIALNMADVSPEEEPILESALLDLRGRDKNESTKELPVKKEEEEIDMDKYWEAVLKEFR